MGSYSDVVTSSEVADCVDCCRFCRPRLPISGAVTPFLDGWVMLLSGVALRAWLRCSISLSAAADIFPTRWAISPPSWGGGRRCVCLQM